MRRTYFKMKANEKYLYTKEQKIKLFGQGEWVDEPDLIEFEYKKITCIVERRIIQENLESDLFFGGFLCGYISIPLGHKYYHKEYEDIDIDCHGGLTFGEVSDQHWIGFDCAHLFDYIPSFELFKKTNEDYNLCMKRFSITKAFERSILFNQIYRNIEFCINQCKSMVDQLINEKENEIYTPENIQS